jgi:xylitol oxidase
LKFQKLKKYLERIKNSSLENKYNLNFIQEIRFTKGDDFWLSACYKRDAIWLGLYNYAHEKWDKVLPEYEAFAKKYNGRPHWGKEFTMDKNYLHQQYEKMADFKKVKRGNGSFQKI